MVIVIIILIILGIALTVYNFTYSYFRAKELNQFKKEKEDKDKKERDEIVSFLSNKTDSDFNKAPDWMKEDMIFAIQLAKTFGVNYVEKEKLDNQKN